MDYYHLLTLFLKSIFVGFIIAVPVGPIAILCIRRTLSHRFSLGLATGLGAGFADTVFGSIVGFSLATLANFITEYDHILRLVGGITLLWIGVSILKTNHHFTTSSQETSQTLIMSFISSFLLTLTNPITLLAFTAVFASIGVSTLGTSYIYPCIIVSGVFVGANGWWLSLCTVVRLMKHHLTETTIQRINQGSAISLIGFSLYILITLGLTLFPTSH